MKEAICFVGGQAVSANIATCDLGHVGDELADVEGGSGQASLMESFLRQFVEHCGGDDELSPEGTVELRVIGAVVGAGHFFNIPSSIFMGQYETVADVGTSGLRSFTLNEGGD